MPEIINEFTKVFAEHIKLWEMKQNDEEEVLKDLKHNLAKFDEDYKRIFEYYKEDDEQHLSWRYENAISLALISIQDVMTDIGMLEYLWKKKAKEHDEKVRQKLKEVKRAKGEGKFR